MISACHEDAAENERNGEWRRRGESAPRLARLDGERHGRQRAQGEAQLYRGNLDKRGVSIQSPEFEASPTLNKNAKERKRGEDSEDEVK